MIYRVADRFVESDLPLPELCAAPAVPADWRIVLRPGAAAPRRPQPFHYWNAAHGYRWASFARRGPLLVLHFARTALFEVDEAARIVTCYPIGRTPFEVLRPVLINQVFPLLLGHERLVLHASAVATPAGAVVFAGPPGRGKSTIAAALARRGLPLITDDFLVIDQQHGRPRAVPSGIEPRLWPDSFDALMPGARRRFPLVAQRTTKRRVSPAGSAGLTMATEPIAIAQVFLFGEPADTDRIEPITSTEAMLPATASTFVARVDEPAIARQTFERVLALVTSVPVSRLVTMRDFTWLDRFCDRIERRLLARTG